MMQAVKQSRGAKTKWYVICLTNNKTAGVAFDRFRIDGSDLSGIKVGCFYSGDEIAGVYFDEKGAYVTDTPRQTQPFHSGGGWTAANYEHDFSFDFALSPPSTETTINTDVIVISGLKPEHIIYQVYAAPTGFSATRGKTTGIVFWDYKFTKVQSSGSQIGRLRLENQGQNVIPYETQYSASEGAPIYALEYDLRGTSAIYVDTAFKQIVAGGLSNGTFRFDNASVAAQSDKTILEGRGWTLQGIVATS